jgi:hypothetical protein
MHNWFKNANLPANWHGNSRDYLRIDGERLYSAYWDMQRKVD